MRAAKAAEDSLSPIGCLHLIMPSMGIGFVSEDLVVMVLSAIHGGYLVGLPTTGGNSHWMMRIWLKNEIVARGHSFMLDGGRQLPVKSARRQ
jgi:hypothetical protein